MQFVNRNMREGRQEIGAIDLMSKMSYFEVPEKDAEKVMRALDGTTYKGRQVRCNDADRGNSGSRRAAARTTNTAIRASSRAAATTPTPRARSARAGKATTERRTTAITKTGDSSSTKAATTSGW